MGSSAVSSPPFRSANPCRSSCRFCSRGVLPFRPLNPFWGFPGWTQRRRVCLFSLPPERWPIGAAGNSWWHQGRSNDGFGGWLIAQPETEKKGETSHYFPRFRAIGVGASVAVLIAAFVHFSLSRKGIKFQVSMLLPALHGLVMPLRSGTNSQSEDSQNSGQILEDESVIEHNGSIPRIDIEEPASGRKQHIIPVAADSTQQEALIVLKKLKIVEDDVKPDELCTRREYARWLVKANSLLERNPRHKIVLSVVTGSSVVTAFDDVAVDDPDFWYIQGAKSNISDESGSVDHRTFDFEPESCLSRVDLVNWRVQLEYPFVTGIEEKMLRKNLDFMDLDSVGADASPALFMDIQSGNKSITRRVFGNIRRLQPRKPATKAQAAVALTSGRMAEAIQTELRRLEAENASRSAEMEDIRHEIMCRGEIERFWEEKLNEEKIRGLEVQNKYLAALNELNEERMALEKDRADHTKESVALDCQGQLLVSLKEEVKQLQAMLINERASLLAEQESLESEYVELRNRQEATAEAKSILEVEKEALRILRSWVEEEALKSQLRAKVLESAARRWKGDEQFNSPQISSPENRDEC
ncbi:hypothetical protein Taro_015285 [Colocasia esculenta]|uniref:SLH domain-containing protein n=1 Tax=Colocasia esculenta TaxID=4460 RepID=A0A843UKF6_COLES|nr:hypothetical protein [Colocasia esculenta]